MNTVTTATNLAQVAYKRKCRCGQVFTVHCGDIRRRCRLCSSDSSSVMQALQVRARDIDFTDKTVSAESSLHPYTIKGMFHRGMTPALPTLIKMAHALGCRMTIETMEGETIYVSRANAKDAKDGEMEAKT